MAKAKKQKMVKVQLGAAVTTTIAGYKFINGQAIVPEKVAKAKRWKIIDDMKPVEDKPAEKAKPEKTSKKKQPNPEPAFTPAPDDK